MSPRIAWYRGFQAISKCLPLRGAGNGAAKRATAAAGERSRFPLTRFGADAKFRLYSYVDRRSAYKNDILRTASVAIPVPERQDIAARRAPGRALLQDRTTNLPGNDLDFQVRVRERVLLNKAHSSLRTVNEKVQVRINPEKCIAIPDSAAANASQ